MTSNTCQPWIPQPREAMLSLALAVGLTLVFWWPLWCGGGLQGGDLYSYYMPQKAVLSEALQSGELPLWNDRTGFGYPAVAESQTGVLYPPNWILYSWLDVNTAYVTNQLLHYVVAFLATWGLARQLGLSMPAAGLAALAFVYGWLPPRLCLEWAAVGAAYFAILLWCAVGWLQTGCPRSLGALSVALGLDLLAGHFHLAFIAILAVGILALWNVRGLVQRTASSSTSPGRSAGLILGLCAGLVLATAQLWPTWELKQASQRHEVGATFDPGYGHMPPGYLVQLIAPWWFHGSELSADVALEQMKFAAYPALTNKVEAHLYVGLIPFLLACAAVGSRAKSSFSRGPWIVFVCAGLILATGWPLVVLKYLPGFSFFMGPGRYGILAAMGLALLAGAGWDQWIAPLLQNQQWWGWRALIILTTLDLWAVSREYQWGVVGFFGRQVFYVTLLDDVPIDFQAESNAAERFLSDPPGVRLYAPGANMPSLLKVSSLPVYLGLGPRVYFTPEMQIDFKQSDPARIAAAVQHLRDWGVTHLLLQERLDTTLWPADYTAPVLDPVLNRAMGRPEPFYLYRLVEAKGRAILTGPGEITRFASTPDKVTIEYTAPQSCELILRDLSYPGWEATLDGQPVDSVSQELFRQIAAPSGTHTVVWNFRPASVLWGGIISSISFVAVLTGTWIAYRNRRMCQFG